MATTYAIPNGATVMAVTLYTGDGTSSKVVNNGVNNTTGVTFQPDMVWLKVRNTADNHGVGDSVRGAPKLIQTNLTTAEIAAPAGGFVGSFNSNGFTVAAGGTSNLNYNTNGNTYVAWQWKAGGTPAVSNTSGNITSTVSANTTAGFSVVTYTGNGLTNQSIGHGLGATPGMVIIKQRDGTANWLVHHQSQPTGYTVYLNLTNAQDSGTSQWGTSPQTSSLFYVGYTAGATGSNVSASTYVAYCWAPVAGYSAFGSYTGNGSVDGPFVYLGFRPRFVLIKRSDSTGNWFIWDASRNTYNTVNNQLYPDSSSAEQVQDGIDFLSNGFKIRFSSTFADRNASGGTYIYAAFAENPFKYANAR